MRGQGRPEEDGGGRAAGLATDFEQLGAAAGGDDSSGPRLLPEEAALPEGLPPQQPPPPARRRRQRQLAPRPVPALDRNDHRPCRPPRASKVPSPVNKGTCRP